MEEKKDESVQCDCIGGYTGAITCIPIVQIGIHGVGGQVINKPSVEPSMRLHIAAGTQIGIDTSRDPDVVLPEV